MDESLVLNPHLSFDKPDPSHALAKVPQLLRQVGIDSPWEHSRRLLPRPLWREIRNDLGDVDVHAVHPAFVLQLRTRRAPHARRRPLFGRLQFSVEGKVFIRRVTH